MKNIVIIGAGPAGLLLAHYLLSRGSCRIRMYERRPDPRSVAQSNQQTNQRTFPISLQLRGLRSLQEIPGLEAAVAERGVWSKGAVLHSKKGKPREIERKTPLLLIDRNQLTQVLLEKLIARDDANLLTVAFDCACVEVDTAGLTVTLQPKEGEPFVESFEYLVGADGVRSQVRETLVAKGEMRCEQDTIPDAYKSLFMPRMRAGKSYELAADRIHTWTIDKGMRMLMAPQPGDWLHGTFIFPADNNPLEALSTGEAVQAYFQEKCPSLAQLMPIETAAAIAQRPVSRVTTVKCDRMQVQNRVLLIGDAIHAVSPSVGQGCNASLQDVQVFNQCLDRCSNDWAQALPAFSHQRLPDVHALRELSNYAFPRSKRMTLEFILRLTLGKKLGRWLPQLAKPLPMQLLTEEAQSYSEVLEQTHNWVERVKQSMQT